MENRGVFYLNMNKQQAISYFIDCIIANATQYVSIAQFIKDRISEILESFIVEEMC